MNRDELILVTGAAGFTGKALALRLAKMGFRVRGTVRPGGNRDTQELEEAGVEIVEANMGNPQDASRMVDGCARVFNIAALFRRAGVSDEEYYRVNRDGTRQLLEASVANGVKRFVHCSTIGVCGHIANPPADEQTPYNPGDIYQVTKMEGEKVALDFFRKEKIPGVVIRPASIYGPGDLRLLKLFKMISRRRFVIVGNGRPTFHMVYIDDLVNGFILGMEREEVNGGVFIVAGEEYLPLNRLFETIASVLGVPRPWLRIPAWPIQILGTVVEKTCVPLGIEPPIYRRRVDFFTKNRAFSIAKAKDVLGYVPEVSVEEGVRRTAEWYRKQGLL